MITLLIEQGNLMDYVRKHYPERWRSITGPRYNTANRVLMFVFSEEYHDDTELVRRRSQYKQLYLFGLTVFVTMPLLFCIMMW